MSKKVSMQQIADTVGLSKYAVSKALAGKEGVSPRTRERIIEAATQLGYFRQQKGGRAASASPKTGAERTADEFGADKRAVAILMPNIRLQTMESDFWSLIVQGIGQELSERGLGMLIITEETAEHFAQILNPDRLLGVIGVGEVSTSMLLEVQRLGLPFVLTDHEDPLVPSDSVFASNIDSMALITGHLLGLGHRSFWFLGDPGYSRSFADRWIGFRKALEDQSLRVDPDRERILLSGTDRELNVRMLSDKLDGRLPEEGTLPTAWVAANDQIALSAIRVLKERGIGIPTGISVTGFDNIEESGRSEVPLTTIHVRKEQLGGRAVMALLDRIRTPGKPFEKINLACEMVIRSSTGHAKQ